jgi:hypothetical protein
MSNHRNQFFLSALPVATNGSQSKAKARVAIPPAKPSALPRNYHTYEQVDKSAVAREFRKIYAARRTELVGLWDDILRSHHSKTSYIDIEKLNNSSWRPAAKDTTVRPAVFHMIQIDPKIDFDANAKVGPSAPPTSLAFLTTMANVGKRRGFDVHVQYANDERLNCNLGDNVVFTRTHDVITSPWIEDCGSFTPAGMTIPPPMLMMGVRSKVSEEMNDKRFREIINEVLSKEAARIYGPHNITGHETIEELSEKFCFLTSCYIARLATYDNYDEVDQTIHRALASQRKIRADLTYIDGGNLFIGVLNNGQRFALVGRNSVEFSRALLWEQLQDIYIYPTVSLSDDIMRYFIAVDLRIPFPRNIVFVEQPAYHLDCVMMLLNGAVVINDSRAARALELKWHCDRGASYPVNDEAFQKSISDAYAYGALEDKAARDIQEQLPQLRVYRAAIVFRNEFGRMNFANGEVGTDSHGRQFFITNGGIPEAELHIRNLMAVHGVEVEFVPLKESQVSLNDEGGLGCRAKCEEKVELLTALALSPDIVRRRPLHNRHNLFSSALSKDSLKKEDGAAAQQPFVRAM